MMKILHTLKYWDDEWKILAFTRDELGRIMGERSSTLSATLHRLTVEKILVKAARNLYVYALTKHSDLIIPEMVTKLRNCEVSYESYESALGKLGVIDQMPIDRVTIATSGRSQVFYTPYCVLDMTHSTIPLKIVLEHTSSRGKLYLPMADEYLARLCMKRSNRGKDLLAENDEKNRRFNND